MTDIKANAVLNYFSVANVAKLFAKKVHLRFILRGIQVKNHFRAHSMVARKDFAPYLAEQNICGHTRVKNHIR